MNIKVHMQDIYGLKVSDITVSRITDKISQLLRNSSRDPVCTDDLAEFSAAINTVFLKAEI